MAPSRRRIHQTFLEVFEAGEVRYMDRAELRWQFHEATRFTGQKDRRLSIRRARSDLREVRARQREGKRSWGRDSPSLE
jgi:hypothetical protein